MNRETFIKKLESFQTSAAPTDVKIKAIAKLKNEFFNQDRNNKINQLLCDMSMGSAELKYSEFQ
jgi:hypothetical protein